MDDRTDLLVGCCGLIDPGMTEAEATAVAERLKAVADPTRVRMLNLLLRNGELCVCDVQLNFDLSQPTISHHLGILRRAGLVHAEVRGKWTWYRVNEEALDGLSAILRPALARAATPGGTR